MKKKTFKGFGYSKPFFYLWVLLEQRRGKYIDYPAKRGHTEFSLFEHYPEYFERIEVEI